MRDAKDLQAVVDVSAAAYSMPKESVIRAFGPDFLLLPGVDIFLARKDGVPMGSGVTHRNGPFVGVYTMATPPEKQRQGVGRAIIDALTAHHMERDAKLTIEPIVVAGNPRTYVAADGWTVRTVDRSPAAQFEHTVMATKRGPVVLSHCA